MWERAAIGVATVLLVAIGFYLAVRWLLSERGRSVAAEAKSKTAEEAFDALQRAQQAEARTRALSRSQRIDMLLQRARRRTAARLPGDEGAGGPGAGQDGD